jgi:transposase-like protein
MDLARTVYSFDLKIAAMRALDAGSATGEIARKYQLSPKLLERWRGEWRAQEEAAFPGIGRSSPRSRGAERRAGYPLASFASADSHMPAIRTPPSASDRVAPFRLAWPSVITQNRPSMIT